jgi:Lar family restriction alleviation protein
MSTVVPISPEIAMTRACADVTRPCPFCGQLDKIEMHDDEGYDESEVWGTAYFVACGNCGSEGPKVESPALAAASWNHRATI